MNELLIAQIGKDALKTALMVAGPALLVSLVVGLMVSVFQVVTSLPLLFGRYPSFGLRPELGYASDDLGSVRAKLFVAGVGPLWTANRPPGTEIRYVPRFLYGDRAVGFRHGLSLLTAFTTLGLELSHQMLWVDGRKHEDVRLVFSFDPALIAGGLFVLGAFVFGGGGGHGRPLLVDRKPVLAPLVRGARLRGWHDGFGPTAPEATGAKPAIVAR